MFSLDKKVIANGNYALYRSPYLALIPGASFTATYSSTTQRLRTSRTVEVTFCPEYDGVFKATLHLIFHDENLGRDFSVYRALKGIAGSIEDQLHLMSIAAPQDPAIKAVGYTPPSQCFPVRSPHPSDGIPHYPLPQIVYDAMRESFTYENLSKVILADLAPDSLTQSTYQDYFKVPLWLEEGQQQ